MGIFGFLRRKIIKRSLCNPFTYAGSGGVYVSDQVTAMKIAAVYRCVSILSSGVASLPFEFLRFNRAEGYFMDFVDSRLYYLLTVMANRRMTAYEFMRNLIIEKVMRGNAYVIPIYESGEVVQLVLCSPYSCTYEKTTDTYTVNDAVNHIYGTYPSDQVIHIRNESIDGGYTGVSTITFAANVLGISATADKETMKSFAGGGRLKGIIANDMTSTKGFGELQDSQLNTVADNVQEQLNQGKDVISIHGGAQFSPMSISPADMELLESKKFGVLEICRFFGVHPDKVFAGQSTNYKASEMSQVSFLTDTLQPTLRQIETEFGAKLISYGVFTEYKFKFDTSTIYTTDLATEGAYMTTTLSNGVMSINDWRRKKDLKPVAGGDEVFISCNVAPIGSAKIRGESQTASTMAGKK